MTSSSTTDPDTKEMVEADRPGPDETNHDCYDGKRERQLETILPVSAEEPVMRVNCGDSNSHVDEQRAQQEAMLLKPLTRGTSERDHVLHCDPLRSCTPDVRSSGRERGSLGFSTF
jgi:hypothetical protein